MVKRLTPEQLAGDVDNIAGFLREGSLQPLTQMIVQHAHHAIRHNFETSTSPSGRVWPPRKRIGDGHPLLIDTTKLMKAATGVGIGAVARAEARQAVVGVDRDQVPYAAVHQFGFPPMNLPQRAYLGVREDALRQIDKLVADWIHERL